MFQTEHADETTAVHFKEKLGNNAILFFQQIIMGDAKDSTASPDGPKKTSHVDLHRYGAELAETDAGLAVTIYLIRSAKNNFQQGDEGSIFVLGH